LSVDSLVSQFFQADNWQASALLASQLSTLWVANMITLFCWCHMQWEIITDSIC